MKKIVTTIVMLIALLAMTTGAAFAGSALELVSVSNNGAGPTFVFKVTGEFSQEELENGFVSVEGGEDFELYCAQQDEDTVVCHASKKVGASAVVVGFGGARFWVDVPDETQEKFCYPVYDWNTNSLLTSTGWADYGPYCQESAAFDRQGIFFQNPIFGITPYWYYQNGVDVYDWENEGPGYYFYFAP